MTFKNGHRHSEEIRRKISEAKKGSKNPMYKVPPWNKGKTGVYSKAVLKKMSEAKENYVPWSKGKQFSKVHRKNISLHHRKFNSKESKIKASESQRGDKCYLWKGGISFEPYGIAFSRQLKKQIRERDQHRCQECFRHQEELRRKLCIHHIDFNKNNNNPNNLISLCDSCHSQTNFDRDHWIGYFNDRLMSR